MKYKINLLPSSEESTLDKVIYFSLNYLRYILVITQIVVIFVFFYKFKVDQEIIDLKEAADQKKEIIEISQPLLKEAYAAEFKINEMRPIFDKQTQLLDQVNYILSVFPEPLYLTKLKVEEKQIFLEGYSLDAEVIRQFYNRLQKDKKFELVDLTSLKKTEIGYEFILVLGQNTN